MYCCWACGSSGTQPRVSRPLLWTNEVSTPSFLTSGGGGPGDDVEQSKGPWTRVRRKDIRNRAGSCCRTGWPLHTPSQATVAVGSDPW